MWLSTALAGAEWGFHAGLVQVSIMLRQAQLNTTFIGIHNREEKLGEFVKDVSSSCPAAASPTLSTAADALCSSHRIAVIMQFL